MAKNNRMMILALSATTLILVAVVLWIEKEQAEMQRASSEPIVTVFVPSSLNVDAERGRQHFNANCMVCHGENAQGKNGIAPPLVHKIYEPSHHGDESFQRAAAQGVRAHHWRFGDMPAISSVSRGEMELIIAYVRSIQRANGIY